MEEETEDEAREGVGECWGKDREELVDEGQGDRGLSEGVRGILGGGEREDEGYNELDEWVGQVWMNGWRGREEQLK